MKKTNNFRLVVIVLFVVLVVGGLFGVAKALEKDEKKDLTDTDTSFSEEIVEPDETVEGHIHEYGEFEIVVSASCIQTGLQKAFCSGCNAYKSVTIPKLDHSFDEGTVTVEPTCGKTGIRVFVCELCDEKKEESIPKLTTHTLDSGKITLEPTCISSGIKTFSCLTCSYKENFDIARSSTHNYNISGVCTICGGSCSHKWSSYVSSSTDSLKHERECSLCKTKQLSSHEFVNSVCSSCGFVCEHSFDDEHRKDLVIDFDSTMHTYSCIYVCVICKYEEPGGDGSPHNFVNGICDFCGCVNPSACSHSDVYTTGESCKSIDESSHQYIIDYYCRLCGSSLENSSDIRSHEFLNGSCTACGKVCMHDGSGVGDCSYCGLYLGSGVDPDYSGNGNCDHSGYDTWSDGDRCHGWTQCTNCWATLDYWHSPDDNNEDGICDFCGESV